MVSRSAERGATAGPVLFLRGCGPDRADLVALVVYPSDMHPGDLVTECGTFPPELIHRRSGPDVLRYTFALPARADAWYELDGERYPVDAAYGADLRLAYVSCNGQEHGDLDRPSETRNLMWHRLADRHREAPLHLLLHGGDQLYADEVTLAHPLSRNWPDEVPRDIGEPARLELASALGDAFFLRYVKQLAQPHVSWLQARVPSLSMWDDHDICDGWGSLPHDKLDSPLGRTLFATAREHFLLFQCGVGPGALPNFFLDATGQSLTWSVRLPGLHLIAPDLRSERRRDRIIGDRGWRLLRDALSRVEDGKVLLLSSVPVLGPRLSLVERVMHLSPRMEKYEDDLRDQWQSRAHRAEWQALLHDLIALHGREGVSITILSGEIHLATRGTMQTPAGDIHQLVASGVSHPPPPRAYARALGALASFGEGPLRGHRIRLHPLPGKRRTYTAERNYLTLERTRGEWTASWDLEESATTLPLAI